MSSASNAGIMGTWLAFPVLVGGTAKWITRKGRAVRGTCYRALSTLNKEFYRDIPEHALCGCILSWSKTGSRRAEGWIVKGR